MFAQQKQEKNNNCQLSPASEALLSSYVKSLISCQSAHHELTCVRWSCEREAGRSACIQESLRGLQPIWPGSTYTMPHLLTVAGDATIRSCTSNIMFCTQKGGHACFVLLMMQPDLAAQRT